MFLWLQSFRDAEVIKLVTRSRRRDDVEVRASALPSVDLVFIPPCQKILSGIHSFPT